MSTPENEPPWERQLLEKVAFAALREQRAKRRWGIFFKLAGLSYLVAVLVMVVDWGGSEQLADARHTAVVHLHGTIEAQGEASAQNINDALEEAFADKRTAGVILRVNSPGGSPVQAGIVHDEIRRLRTKHPQIPLYAVVEDVCASGGYYIAVAADKIFVDKASIVGSIGVLMDAFGFTGTMEKLGIERRLLTAGDNKGFLDPFSPQDAKQKAHAQVLLREIHEQFIDVVRRGRGDRLKDAPELFSGLMWTGSQSVGLGLADGFGTVGSVARDVIKADRIVEFTIRENIAERFARRFRADSTDGVVGSLLGAGRLMFR
ncbi:MAG: S49 family peptidase [Candidatus Accumulibacter necessarius]